MSSDSRGRIILEPAVVLPETELSVINDEVFWARVAKSTLEPHEIFELSPTPDPQLQNAGELLVAVPGDHVCGTPERADSDLAWLEVDGVPWLRSDPDRALYGRLVWPPLLMPNGPLTS